MHNYSLSVALFDYIPVLVTAMGLALLARAISQVHRPLATIAWVGAVLIPVGGLCKASWKLIIALGHAPIPWLENLLFIALAPGFVIMAFCLQFARRAWQQGLAPTQASYPRGGLLAWLSLTMGGALLAAWLLPESRLWFLWLLAITTIANAALIVQAIIAARWAGLGWPISACFCYSFAAILALSGLSRLPDGETTAWIQEGVNLSAQLALAVGLWRLSQRMQEN